MGAKLVSIVIPVFNLLHYTHQCLESLFETTSIDDTEIIVVDNGSSLATQKYLRSLHYQIKYLRNQSNSGFACACNKGAQEAQGKYLVFLNNDIIAQPGWLNALLDSIENLPEIGIVGAKLLYPDGTIQHCGITFSENKMPFHIYRGCPATLPCTTVTRNYQAVTAACMLVSRKLFFKVNAFDESYVNGMEDMDFAMKVRLSGYQIKFTPSSVLIHFESRSPDRQKRMTDNYQLFMKRWANQITFDAQDVLTQDQMKIELSDYGIGYRHPSTMQYYPSPEEVFTINRQLLFSVNNGKALSVFKNIISTDPFNELVLRTLSEFYYNIKDYHSSYKMVNALHELYPDDVLIQHTVIHLQKLLTTATISERSK